MENQLVTFEWVSFWIFHFPSLIYICLYTRTALSIYLYLQHKSWIQVILSAPTLIRSFLVLLCFYRKLIFLSISTENACFLLESLCIFRVIRRIDITMILSLLIHEYGFPLHLFNSFLISLRKFLNSHICTDFIELSKVFNIQY